MFKQFTPLRKSAFLSAAAACVFGGALRSANAAFETWYSVGSVDAYAYAGYPDVHSVPFGSFQDDPNFGPAHLTAHASSYDPTYGHYCDSGATLDVTLRRGLVDYAASSSASGNGGSGVAGTSLSLKFSSMSGDSGTIEGHLGNNATLFITGSNGFSRTFLGSFTDTFSAEPGVMYHLVAQQRASAGGPTSSSMNFHLSIPSPGTAGFVSAGLALAARRRRSNS
ncbi:MAG: hypothetical protein ACKVZJ_07570 [Phycisphaerales bacterium]